MSCVSNWEKKAIENIQQRANEIRIDVKNRFDQTKNRLKTSLKTLSDELINSQADEEFTETELNQWQKRLERLASDLEQLSNSKIKFKDNDMSDSILLIQPRFFQLKKFNPQVNGNPQWDREGIVVVGRDPLVNSFFHLNQPSAIDIDDDGTMFITDTGNHRILAWRIDTNRGEVIAGGNGKGDRIDQLDTPVAVLIDRINSCLIISEIGNRRISRWSFQQKLPVGEVIISNIVSWGLAMDDEGCLYVSDSERHEVRCYSSRDSIQTGKIVAGGNGQGAGLDQLNDPRYICVDDDRSIYISDSNNRRVVRWTKNKTNGVIIIGGQSERANVERSNDPRGLFVDYMGSVYIADQLNRRILCLTRSCTQMINVAGELDVQRSPHPVNRNVFGRAIPQNPKVPLNQSKVLGSVTLDLKGNLYVVCSDVNCVMQFPIK